MTPRQIAAALAAEIAGMQGYDAAVALADMGYSGWVHESAVWRASQGWTWRVTSTRWEGGYVVRTCTSRPPYRYAAPERDVAAAQCAVAISAILESRGGVCCQESQEVI